MIYVAKIIDVDFSKNKVCVEMEDNSVKELPAEIFKFEPQIGKNVNVYQKTDGSYVVDDIETFSDLNALDSKGGYKIGRRKFVLVTYFLGGLGVHKFITGRILQGILYLLCSFLISPFISGILSLIEIFVVAGKNDDADGMIEVKGFFG